MQPYAVSSDGAALFLADELSHVVRRIDLASGIATVVAGSGSLGSGGDGGPATAAELLSPRGVAIGLDGDVFISDSGNNRIRRVDAATGLITTLAGTGEQGFSGDGGPAASARLFLPRGLAIDASGDLLVADTFNRRVRRIQISTGIISTIVGNGSSGSGGDGGPATGASLTNVQALSLDSAGNLFLSDYSTRRVRRVDAATGIITTVAGTGTAGFSGDGGPASAAMLNGPSGIAVDCTGALLIADSSNNRVRRVDPATGTIATIAGGGPFGPGGDGGPATDTYLLVPFDVAVDSTCSVFIGERGGNRVRRVSTTGIITTAAGNGVPQYSGDGGSAVDAQISRSIGVASDLDGNLYLADGDNQRIRRVDVATGVITTIAGNG
jgi:sugar lactone lactonase YvrE